MSSTTRSPASSAAARPTSSARSGSTAAPRSATSGRPGIAWCALSAVDIALWDLHARLLGVPLTSLLPACHDRVPVYGSGGFCSYSLERIAEQLGGWVEQGIPRVKMKLGRDPAADPARLDAARAAIGDAELYVDANGAFSAKEALRWARRYEAGLGRALVRGAGLVRRPRRAAPRSASTRPSTSPPASTPTCPPTSAT